MQSIIGHVRNWFLPKEEYFDAFINNDTRLESWFKAELIVLFSRLKQDRVIDAFEREPNLYDQNGQRHQIDFSVTIKEVKNHLELKAVCISQSKGTPRNLKFYFRDDNVGLIKDFKKLDLLDVENKWIMAFVYPKPTQEDWDNIISSLSQRKCLTTLDNYPKYFFIALFQV